MAVTAQAIADLLKLPLVGPDMTVERPCVLSNLRPGGLAFATRYDPAIEAGLNAVGGLLAIVTPEYAGRFACSHVISPNPRLSFARATAAFFAPKPVAGVAKTAVLGRDVSLGSDVSIGEYCVIGNRVTVGDRTFIAPHVTIHDGVRIGRDCLIRAHVVIGDEGFGFEKDAEGRPIRIPHLGSVEIGDGVEVGALSHIAAGTVANTVIGDFVKIDALVHVAHNVRVGMNTIITACAELSGSVEVGANAWIAPNASVKQNLRIGKDTLVGLAAAVTHDVEDGDSVAGNPAKRLRPAG